MTRLLVFCVAAAVIGASARTAGDSASRRYLIVSSRAGFVASFRFAPEETPALSEEKSRIRLVGTSGEPLEVAFLTASADGRFIYAAARADTARPLQNPDPADDCVIALSFNPETGALAEIDRMATGGSRPTHLALDREEKFLVVANNAGNSVSIIPRFPDGRIGKPTQNQKAGEGPHGVTLDPSGKFVFAPNRGVPVDVRKGSIKPEDDRPGSNIISQFVFANGTLSPNNPPYLAVTSGVNPSQNPHPRHMIFHPNGRWAYATNALNDTVTLMTMSGNGTLTEACNVWGVPENLRKKPALPYRATASEIALSPSGRFLYVSNAAFHILVVFRIDPKTGEPELIQHVPTSGEAPRQFAIDATGSWLVIGHEKGSTIVVFHIDLETGKLVQAGPPREFPEPFCQIFHPGGK